MMESEASPLRPLGEPTVVRYFMVNLVDSVLPAPEGQGGSVGRLLSSQRGCPTSALSLPRHSPLSPEIKMDWLPFPEEGLFLIDCCVATNTHKVQTDSVDAPIWRKA